MQIKIEQQQSLLQLNNKNWTLHSSPHVTVCGHKKLVIFSMIEAFLCKETKVDNDLIHKGKQLWWLELWINILFHFLYKMMSMK